MKEQQDFRIDGNQISRDQKSEFACNTCQMLRPTFSSTSSITVEKQALGTLFPPLTYPINIDNLSFELQFLYLPHDAPKKDFSICEPVLVFRCLVVYGYNYHSIPQFQSIILFLDVPYSISTLTSHNEILNKFPFYSRF